MISMKKVIFTITLFFIMGLPFSSQAIPLTPQKKTRHQPISFSKKQQKLNFFQRIILKKIKRKIARQARKKNKYLKDNPTDKLADDSLLFGAGSILALLIGYLAILSSATTLGGVFLGILLVGGLAIVLGMLALNKGFKYFDSVDGFTAKDKSSRWTASLGIFLGIIGTLGGIWAVSLFIT